MADLRFITFIYKVYLLYLRQILCTYQAYISFILSQAHIRHILGTPHTHLNYISVIYQYISDIANDYLNHISGVRHT